MAIDITRITSRLWVGAAPDSFDRQAALADAREIRGLGVTLVIDCRAEADDNNLWAAVPGVRYLANGVHDSGEPPPFDFFSFGVESYLAHVSGCAGDVLVHCESGSNRSPALALAILLSEGDSHGDARARLKSARSHVGHRYDQAAVDWFAAFAD